MKGECSHNPKYLSKINNSDLFVFCKNCGSIIYKKSEKTYINSIKPSSYQNKTEMDPLELFPTYINTPFTKIAPNSPYLIIREHAISRLEKYRHSYNFSEDTFYLAMTYMDIIFKNFGEKTIRGKEFDLFIINCLLLAGKFYEKDIREMASSVEKFWELNNCRISDKEIQLNEIECLRLLNYKLDHQSVYDLLKFLMYNGIVYQNDSYTVSNIIYNYSLKVFRDIMNSNIALMYHPVPICFSIIIFARKKFKLNTKYLKKIYNIKSEDYKECYDEIKQYIEKIENPYNRENVIKKPPMSTNKLNTLKKHTDKENKINLLKDNENDNNNKNESINITTVKETSQEKILNSPSTEQINKTTKNLKYVEGVDKKINIKNFLKEGGKFIYNGRKRPRSYNKFKTDLDLVLLDSVKQTIFIRKTMHATTCINNDFNYKNYINDKNLQNNEKNVNVNECKDKSE